MTAVGAGLQWLKTYRDTMRETIKTHEDAINMGMDQIDTLISELEEKNKNASKRAKVGSAFGWNGLHRRNKQLQILQTLKSLKEENALVSVQSLIDGLEKETEKENMIADTLARIDAGHACKTNFISTTDSTGKGLGREQTAIKRKELMDKLQQSAIATPLTVTDDHGTTTTIQVTANSTPEEWSRYRSAIQANETYKHTHDYLINRYDALTHDIKSNRNKQSRSAAGKYTLNAAGAALATGVVSTGRDAINNGLWEDSIQTTQSQTTQSATEFANFKLSKHDMNMSISSGNNYSGLTDGAMIDTAHIDVGVDAVASRAGSFGDYMSKINAVQSMVDNAGLNATTTTALKNALSQDTLNSVMEAGKQAGADLGNQKLLTLRWAEAIEQLTTHLSEYGLNNVTINNVGYTDLVNDLAIQKSVIGASENLVHRGFDVLLTGTNTITNDEIVTSFRAPNREWSPWAGGLGFINTYATPSTKADTLEKKDDNKQQQPDTMKGQQDALDAPKAVVVPQSNEIHEDGSSAEKATTATPVITPQPAEKEKHEMESDNTFFKSLKEQLSKTKTLTADTIKKLKEKLKGIYESDKSKEYRTTMKKKIL